MMIGESCNPVYMNRFDYNAKVMVNLLKTKYLYDFSVIMLLVSCIVRTFFSKNGIPVTKI